MSKTGETCTEAGTGARAEGSSARAAAGYVAGSLHQCLRELPPDLPLRHVAVATPVTRPVSEWLKILQDWSREPWQTRYRVTTEGALFGGEGRRGIAEGRFMILREDT